MKKLPAFYLKITLSYTHLQIFVGKQSKKQFSREFSENFATVIVIKSSFCVSAEFSTLRTYISCAAFNFQKEKKYKFQY